MRNSIRAGVLVLGSLVGIGVVVLGVSGFTTSTGELATALFWASLAGLVVVLLAESRARRRWTLR